MCLQRLEELHSGEGNSADIFTFHCFKNKRIKTFEEYGGFLRLLQLSEWGYRRRALVMALACTNEAWMVKRSLVFVAEKLNIVEAVDFYTNCVRLPMCRMVSASFLKSEAGEVLGGSVRARLLGFYAAALQSGSDLGLS